MPEDSYYLADLYDVTSPGVPGDADFYVEEAHRADSPVLELGCGTGRVLLSLAEEGLSAIGLDISHAMLAKAREKINACPGEVQRRISLVEADMRAFHLDRTFELILIPYRAFQHLLRPQDQRRALCCIREHLADDGRLIIDLFDPRLEALAARMGRKASTPIFQQKFEHPHNGHRVLLWTSGRLDLADQQLYELWIYEELDECGKMIRRQYRTLQLRWIYRYEMQYLLELCGYRVMALYGDFERGTFRHGGEQIWVVQKAAEA